MLEHKVQGASDSQRERFTVEDLLAPLSQLLNDPNALTCKLEVCFANRDVLNVVAVVLIRKRGSICLLLLLKDLDLFNLGEALF
jgi:hypothetical protein